jgi:hypothetical protein
MQENRVTVTKLSRESRKRSERLVKDLGMKLQGHKFLTVSKRDKRRNNDRFGLKMLRKSYTKNIFTKKKCKKTDSRIYSVR